MVYHGPSKACEPCRRRRVRCDEAKPTCGTCIKRKQQHACLYRDLFDAVHKTGPRSSKAQAVSSHASESSSDSEADNQSLIRYHSQSPPPRNTSPSPFLQAVDPELDSLCFFFHNYVNLPRDAQSNIFIEHVLPLWKNAPDHSPIKPATSAAAATISALWRGQERDVQLAHRLYAKAVSTLRQTFQESATAAGDEILASMFLLDFYESINRRYTHEMENDIHHKAAMALVKSRGLQTFQSETSRRIFAALRAKYIFASLQAKKKVDLDEEFLSEDSDFDLPTAKLDLIFADIGNVMYEAAYLLEIGSAPMPSAYCLLSARGTTPDSLGSPAPEMTFESLLSYLLEINLRLNAWQLNLPVSWEAYRIPDASSTLHHSIRAVGLYNGLCDVYSSLSTAHTTNSWRSSKVLVLQMIKHCLNHLDLFSPSKFVMSEDDIDSESQTLVDDICASIPFHLGSRTTTSFPHEHHEYPPVPPYIRAQANYVDSHGRPTQMTDNDHIRSSAATGGWFVLTPLTAIMRYAAPPLQEEMTEVNVQPVTLRSGQLEWIRGQVKRIHKIYRIPLPQTIGGSPGIRSLPIVQR